MRIAVNHDDKIIFVDAVGYSDPDRVLSAHGLDNYDYEVIS